MSETTVGLVGNLTQKSTYCFLERKTEISLNPPVSLPPVIRVLSPREVHGTLVRYCLRISFDLGLSLLSKNRTWRWGTGGWERSPLTQSPVTKIFEVWDEEIKDNLSW